MQSNERMKITDLSALSGVMPSTIRYYTKEGLLPAPIKYGKTVAFYTQEHLDRLKLIKALQVQENLPLYFIKERIAKGLQDQHGVENAPPLNIDKKEAIVRAAIRIFIEKGYADTSIADIVAEAAIGRGTFYVFFKNKDEIFIDSAERLFFDLYADVWQEVKDEQNMVLRLRKRAWSFLVTYPRWADAMNLLRGASVSPNQAFGEKYQQIMRQITTPLVREIQKGVEQGVIRPINPTLAAHLLLGVVDYCGYLHQLGRYNEIEVFNAINKFLLHGIQQRETH
jgi:AcrR family transcriptional regulator